MENNSETQPPRERPGKKESYYFGFALSILLTLVAYFIVSGNLINGWSLILVIGALATAQVLVQLVFFLHLGEEIGPAWNLYIFLYMAFMVFIIVFGSIWIMSNLNYQMVMQ